LDLGEVSQGRDLKLDGRIWMELEEAKRLYESGLSRYMEG
jgi:hypothetical protein